MKARNKVTGEVVSNFGWSEEYGAVCYTDKDGDVRLVSCTDEWELLNDVDCAAYRREAAKDILCAMVGQTMYDRKAKAVEMTGAAIALADTLIEKLKEK